VYIVNTIYSVLLILLYLVCYVNTYYIGCNVLYYLVHELVYIEAFRFCLYCKE